MAEVHTAPCPECGVMLGSQEPHKDGCPLGQSVIVDKRGKKGDPLPTADELMEQTDGSGPQVEEDEPAEPTEEFHRQQAEWEAMTDEEKQEILARQAGDVTANPYQGAGIETPHEPGQQPVISYFTVIIHEDGTALATDNMDVSGFEKKYDITGAMMHRACTEIVKDIEATDTAVQTVLFMRQQAEHAMAQQRSQALQQQLAKRGAQPRGRRGR